MTTPLTLGAHHIGLAVSKLEETAKFFTELLGWKELGRKAEYPAIFVGDGNVVLTLWAIKEEPHIPFSKNKNVGLHHLAFRIANEETLHAIHDRLVSHGIQIEFAPELNGKGPTKHMMCYEPSGIRLEFTWPGQ